MLCWALSHPCYKLSPFAQCSGRCCWGTGHPGQLRTTSTPGQGGLGRALHAAGTVLSLWALPGAHGRAGGGGGSRLQQERALCSTGQANNLVLNYGPGLVACLFLFFL